MTKKTPVIANCLFDERHLGTGFTRVPVRIRCRQCTINSTRTKAANFIWQVVEMATFKTISTPVPTKLSQPVHILNHIHVSSSPIRSDIKTCKNLKYNTTVTLLTLGLEKLLQDLHSSCRNDHDTIGRQIYWVVKKVLSFFSKIL